MSIPMDVVIEQEKGNGDAKYNNNKLADVESSALENGDAIVPFDGAATAQPDDSVGLETINEEGRQNWGRKIEFIFTCVGNAVGLGNVWRFPYLCFKNGGGAFVFPYIIMVMLLGLPMFFFEFSLGQFASLGPISVWNISPLGRGIGYAMILSCWILVVYYQVIIAYSFFYLFQSFTSHLPWDVVNQTNPGQDYFYNIILAKSSGIDDLGSFNWRLAGCLLLGWIICAAVLIKGVESLGKISYITAIAPYILLTTLLIMCVLKEGARDGIIYYLTPSWEKLADPMVWTDAATQIFFSLGISNGCLIAMSSYNKFKNNCFRDTCIVVFVNCATSIFAGFVVFSSIGILAHEKNKKITEVFASGPGLTFAVYPEVFTKMSPPPLWSCLFFIMLSILGFGSQFGNLETVISGIQDEMRRFGFQFTNRSSIGLRIAICSFNFLLGLSMMGGSGYFLLYIVDHYLAGFPLLSIAFSELFFVCWIYGIQNFRRDVKQMTNAKPRMFFWICWKYITPFLVAILFFFVFTIELESPVEGSEYPTWAKVIGYMIGLSPPLLIPGWFVVKFCRSGGFILCKEMSKPDYNWGPADRSDRIEFIQRIYSKSAMNVNASSTQLDEFGNRLRLGSGLDESNFSGMLGTEIIEDTGFFQSKRAVAEKLTEAHRKKMMKRAGSSVDICLNDALSGRVLFHSSQGLEGIGSGTGIIAANQSMSSGGDASEEAVPTATADANDTSNCHRL